MSNHAAKPRPKKSLYFGFSKSALAVLVLIFSISLPLLIAHPWTKADHLDWPAVPGHLLETRIVVVHQRDHEFGSGEVDYQVEARVTYKRDGVEQRTWLPVSKQSTDKALLEFWLSQKKSKLCTVRWPPKNPAYIEAVLY